MNRKFIVPAALAALLTPSAAFAQAADPAGSGPIVAALGWLQGTLLGNVATAVAVMAVAAVVVAVAAEVVVAVATPWYRRST